MKQTSLVLILVVLGISGLRAYISDYYSFESSTGVYAPISGTAVPSAIGDDVISGAVDIGFTFNYCDSYYNQILISSNGFIVLGSATNANQNNYLNTIVSNPVIAPLWDDLNTWSGQVKYLLQGEAPFRVLTIQYSEVNWNHLSTSTYDFQVKLYESEKVEFVYGISVGIPSGASASIGINMHSDYSFNMWSVTPGTPASATTTMENSNVSQWPGYGTIYTFVPSAGFPNDLAAQTITGDSQPVPGVTENYSITIRNCGTNPQDYYSVRLMSGITILASVNGPAIQPNVTTTVQIPWTPSLTGNYQVFGKVSLIGDQYNWNDTSGTLNVIVHNADTTIVTIGEGDQISRIPVNMYCNNDLFETIYQASEINTTGVITGLAFYNSFEDSHYDMPIEIWLGMTAFADLNAGWIPSTQLVQVFDGLVDFPSGQNIIEIPFTTPFPYAGANLVMMLNRPMGTTCIYPEEGFFCQTTVNNRSRMVSRYSPAFDPESPPTNSVLITGQFPKTTLYLAAANPEPVFGVAPESHNFGTILMDQTVSQLFSLYNTGATSLIINEISLSQSTMFHLLNLPVFPLTLNGGQSISITAQYAPTEGGNHTETISITDNLTRNVHNVPLTGMCLDPYIYVSPYQQNFDTFSGQELPLDWSNITQSTSIGAGVKLTGDSPHTAPNCAILANSEDINATLLLVAPPLASNLNMNEMRVRFWADGYYLSHFQVGVLTDKSDASTFVVQEELPFNGWWTEYLVSFYTYPGTGKYLAFRFVPGLVNTPVRIDDVIIESLSQADLGTLSFTGPYFPSVGMASEYTVSLFNWGNQPQNNYQIKLFNAEDQEIASVDGPNIPVGTQAVITIPWTPTTPGDTNIYGKIILTGDQNNLNDQTSDYPISVQPLGHIVATRGEGNSIGSMPIDFSHKNNLNETIFYQSDLNFYGAITGVSIYYRSYRTFTAMPTKIWMGTTNDTDLIVGWIPSTQLTLVFDGNIDYTGDSYLVFFDFPTPFQYLSGNLVVMFNRPWDIYHYESGNDFLIDATDNYVSRQIYSNTNTINPAVPGNTGTALHAVYKTSFYVVPQGLGSLSGVVYGNDNLPLANATVTILDGVQTTTNMNGQFFFAQYSPGTYSVICTAPNHLSQTLDNVVIHTGQNTLVNFFLQPVPIEDQLATGFTFLQGNNPNPFTSGTAITYTLKEKTPVKVEIYNLKGQEVITLINDTQSKGKHNIYWNGTDNQGKSVTGGIYFYKMRAGKFSSTRKMILLK